MQPPEKPPPQLITPESIPSEEAVGSPRLIQTANKTWMENGYLEAAARFLDAVDSDSTAEETFIPLFEALNWTVSLDERLGRRAEPLWRGLRFVRNRVHHQWADALEGRELPVSSPLTVGGATVTVSGDTVDWFWKPLAALPDAPTRHPDPSGQQAYEDQLAGKPARDAIEQLKRLLTSGTP